MNTSPLRAAALLLLAGATLTACGASEVVPQPTKTFKNLGAPISPTATASEARAFPGSTRAATAKGGYYVNVYDLQHEVAAAGFSVCEDFKYWGAVSFADGTIACGNQQMMLSVFSAPDKVELYKAKEISDGNKQTYDMTTTWLQGSNWVIRGEAKEFLDLKEKLGGNIVSFSYGPSHR